MASRARFLLVSLILLCSICSAAAWGADALPSLVLQPPTSSPFAPEFLRPSDFKPIWTSEDGAPVSARLSLPDQEPEWVRVTPTVLLPRSLARMEIDDIDSGEVEVAGVVHPLRMSGRTGAAEFVLPLLSGPGNMISVKCVRGGKLLRGHFLLEYSPRQPEPRVRVDSSCSPYALEAKFVGQVFPRWASLGCRLYDVERSDHRTTALEVDVYIDGEAVAQLKRVRLSPDGRASLPSVTGALELSYRIPEVSHLGSLGLGIGPYQFDFQGPSQNVSRVVAMPTLYASLRLAPTARIVAFDATPLSSPWTTDFGLYLHTESARFLDNRATLSLMLGVHALGFEGDGGYKFAFGAPQGIEVSFSDFLSKNRTLTTGFFLFPVINDKGYTNVWLRYGTAALFGEANFILWHEKVDEQRYYSRSIGLSIGAALPFAQFL